MNKTMTKIPKEHTTEDEVFLTGRLFSPKRRKILKYKGYWYNTKITSYWLINSLSNNECIAIKWE